MTTFLIQSDKTDYGLIPQHDFGFETIQAINFDSWYYNEKRYKYELVADLSNISNNPNYVPVGSVEFVCEFMKLRYNVDSVKPINIPAILIPYANREIKRIHSDDIAGINEKVFAKSDTTIKGFSQMVSDKSSLPTDFYLISEVIEIESEFRCFVRNNKLIDIKNYSGYYDRIPNIQVINDMIRDYKNEAPPAYTLDVCIDIKGRTDIIECHNFFSCGLYGFADYTNLLPMLIQSFKWQIEQK